MTPKAVLLHNDIARLIPHHGDMCLLNEVLHYDESRIVCSAISHQLLSNPLRENNALHAICGVEYAAQAMAVHSVLLAKLKSSDAEKMEPRGGRLASVRSVDLHVLRLDDIPTPLTVTAEFSLGDAQSMVYEFHVNAGEQRLLNGKATVILI